MNKVLVIAVVMGGLALGGVFFVAGIFTGISVSLKEEKGTAASEHWPPKTLKSQNPSTEGGAPTPGGGVLAAQTEQEKEKAELRAEDVPQRGIDKLFEKVPETSATTPLTDALKGAAQTSVANKEGAALSSKGGQEVTGKSSSAPQKEKSSAPPPPTKESPKAQEEIPKNLQLEEASPVLVTKPDQLVPSAEELFEELGEEEEPAPEETPQETTSSPVFVLIGTLQEGETARISSLLMGYGYKVFKRKTTERGKAKFLVVSGPFRDPENAQSLLDWLHDSGFKEASLTTLAQLKSRL
ncbi:MAG: hypothetical protein LBF76_00330 [Holosporales bacterium]|jgi:hypothetical protein|nr:hypothetical protein [Holosporales bacterium]